MPHRPEGLPDGQLDDWDDAGCVVLTRYERLQGTPDGAADLSARACAAWSDQALWLAVEVVDDRHHNDFPPETLWLGDSVQLGLDPTGDGQPGEGYDDDDGEWTLALAGGQSEVRVEHGASGPWGGWSSRASARATRLRVPRSASPRPHPARLVPGQRERRRRAGGLAEWTPGIGHQKEPFSFGILELVDRQAVPDPDAGLMEDAGHRPPPPVPVVDASADAGEAARDLGGPDGAPAATGDAGRVDAGPRPGDGGPSGAGDAGGSGGSSGDDGGCQQRPGREPSGAALLLLLGVLARRRFTSRGA
ncbi:MAG: sugar-binding protein [bacterium]